MYHRQYRQQKVRKNKRQSERKKKETCHCYSHFQAVRLRVGKSGGSACSSPLAPLGGFLALSPSSSWLSPAGHPPPTLAEIVWLEPTEAAQHFLDRRCPVRQAARRGQGRPSALLSLCPSVRVSPSQPGCSLSWQLPGHTSPARPGCPVRWEGGEAWLSSTVSPVGLPWPFSRVSFPAFLRFILNFVSKMSFLFPSALSHI